MATVQIFNAFKEAIAEKVHDLGADTLKFALTNAAPSLADDTFSDLAEIAAGLGYTAGGAAVTVTSSAQTGGTYSLVLADTVFTAAGGGIGPFRYLVLYNSTAVGGPLIAFIDYGTAYTLPDGQTFTVKAGTFMTNA